MKVIKYNVKVKIEVNNAKKEEESLKNGLIKAFSYKKKDGNIVTPKLTVSDNSIEIEGLKFRKLISVRKFISDLAEDYNAQCGKINKSENLMTVECSGKESKLYFEIKSERLVKPKEAKGEKKEEKGQSENKS